jgi:hypothetical protein
VTLTQPEPVATLRFAGQALKTGFCASLTVIMNVQVPVLLDASIAEQVTVVVPFAKVAPDDGEQLTLPTPGQLSLAVAPA